MALATAAAVPVMPISPMPRAPRGWKVLSGMLRQVTSMVHEVADVVGGDDAADLDHVGVAVDGDLGEDGSEGLGGVGIFVFAGLGGAHGF